VAGLCLLAACDAATGVPVDPHMVTTDDGLYSLHFHDGHETKLGEPSILMFHLQDADQANVEAATITVTPWMPDHGHGIDEEPMMTEADDGMYEATWTYSMGGRWEITIDVDGDAGVDTVVVAYDVE
jgi:hypothetical protein